jgi:hypothetical protein
MVNLYIREADAWSDNPLRKVLKEETEKSGGISAEPIFVPAAL